MTMLPLIPCGIKNCQMLASNAAILGTQRFCIVPVMNGQETILPLVRFNLCETHLDSVRSNFKEVYHDESSSDYSNVAVFE